ncbi:hypothetical protein PUN28_000509 [Cardiocondyla obscurior]|uniref:Uncharacterized protein n=1 Tax=Cardiocondyla obscurior TaxID=286306 RepID=A0AAW2H015_9HYME
MWEETSAAETLDPGMTRKKKVRRGQRKPPQPVTSSPDSTTGPVAPRIVVVETFPSGQPLVKLVHRLAILQPLLKLLPTALRPWAPCALRLPQPQLTRPPRAALLPGDMRTYRLISSRYRVPVYQGTQTEEPKHTIQHALLKTNTESQTDLWTTTSVSDSEPVTYPGDKR